MEPGPAGHDTRMGPNDFVPSRKRTAANGGESVSGAADPVVVSLLRSKIRFSHEVVAQAVIELEHRGRLRVETGAGPGRAAVHPTGTTDLDDADAPKWERLVMQRLRERARPAVPTPLSLLSTDDGGDFWDWRHELEQDLIERAHRARLIDRALTPRRAAALASLATLTTATAVGCLVAVFFRPSPGFGAALATALFGFILFSAAFGQLASWRASEAGRRTVQEAERSAAAQDPITKARESAIRAAVLPLSKNHVWSSYGGIWRVVGLGSRFGDAKRLPRQVRDALPDRRVLACQVVKRWVVPGGRERSPAYCCAFDDGASSFTWSFSMPEKTWAELRVGAVVMVDFSPRRHRLYQVGSTDGGEL